MDSFSGEKGPRKKGLKDGLANAARALALVTQLAVPTEAADVNVREKAPIHDTVLDQRLLSSTIRDEIQGAKNAYRNALLDRSKFGAFLHQAQKIADTYTHTFEDQNVIGRVGEGGRLIPIRPQLQSIRTPPGMEARLPNGEPGCHFKVTYRGAVLGVTAAHYGVRKDGYSTVNADVAAKYLRQVAASDTFLPFEPITTDAATFIPTVTVCPTLPNVIQFAGFLFEPGPFLTIEGFKSSSLEDVPMNEYMKHRGALCKILPSVVQVSNRHEHNIFGASGGMAIGIPSDGRMILVGVQSFVYHPKVDGTTYSMLCYPGPEQIKPALDGALEMAGK
jgi:hypothetical protein